MKFKRKPVTQVPSTNNNNREEIPIPSTFARPLAPTFRLKPTSDEGDDSLNRRPSTSAQLAAIGSLNNQRGNKTTCLFCRNLVNLSPQQCSKAHSTKLRKVLINLSKFLKISSAEIPRECNSVKFPFCQNCEAELEDLWIQVQVLDETISKINRIVASIERSVVDGEIIGINPNVSASSRMAQLELKKFTRLKDLILEAYRNKLRTRQPQQSNFESRDDNSSHEDIEDGVIPEEAPQTEGFHAPSSSLREGSEERDDDEEFPPSLFPQNVEPPHDNNDDDVDEEVEDDQEYQHQPFQRAIPARTGSSEEGDGLDFQDSNARATNSRCRMIFTNQTTEVDEISVVSFKREVSVTTHEEHEYESDDDDDDDSDEGHGSIFVVTTKRRRLFEGVEIFRVAGVRRRTRSEYLQCSLCPYMLPIKAPKNNSKVSALYLQLKNHIWNVHNAAPFVSRSGQLCCARCNIKFFNLAQFRAHKEQHGANSSPICDVCEKPFREAGGELNLAMHKFSHKNDDERKVALANNEFGSYNTMLSTQRQITNPRRNLNKPGATSSNKKTGNRTVPRIRWNETKKKNKRKEGKSFNCVFCPRWFSKKAGLTCHMKTHQQIANTQVQDEPTPSTSRHSSISHTSRVVPAARPVSSSSPSSRLVTGSRNSGLRLRDPAAAALIDGKSRVRIQGAEGTQVTVSRDVIKFLTNLPRR